MSMVSDFKKLYENFIDIPIFLGVLPENELPVLALIQHGGLSNDRTFDNKAKNVIEEPTLQVMIKHHDYEESIRILEMIKDYNYEINDLLIGSNRYLTVDVTSDILPLAYNTEHYLFSINFTVSMNRRVTEGYLVDYKNALEALEYAESTLVVEDYEIAYDLVTNLPNNPQDLILKNRLYLLSSYFNGGGNPIEIEFYKKEIERLTNELISKNESITELENEISQLQNNLSITTEELEQKIYEIQVLENQVNDLQNEINLLKNKIIELESEIIDLNNQLSDKIEELENSQLLIENLNSQILDLQNQLNDLEENSTEEINQLQLQINKLQTEKSDLEQTVSELENDILILENRVQNLTESYNQQILNLESTINDLEIDKQNLQNQVTDLINEITLLEDEINNLKNTIQSMTTTINEQSTLINQLNNQIFEYQATIAKQPLEYLDAMLNLSLNNPYSKDYYDNAIKSVNDYNLIYGEIEDIDILNKINELDNILLNVNKIKNIDEDIDKLIEENWNFNLYNDILIRISSINDYDTTKYEEKLQRNYELMLYLETINNNKESNKNRIYALYQSNLTYTEQNLDNFYLGIAITHKNELAIVYDFVDEFLDRRLEVVSGYIESINTCENLIRVSEADYMDEEKYQLAYEAVQLLPESNYKISFNYRLELIEKLRDGSDELEDIKDKLTTNLINIYNHIIYEAPSDILLLNILKASVIYANEPYKSQMESNIIFIEPMMLENKRIQTLVEELELKVIDGSIQESDYTVVLNQVNSLPDRNDLNIKTSLLDRLIIIRKYLDKKGFNSEGFVAINFGEDDVPGFESLNNRENLFNTTTSTSNTTAIMIHNRVGLPLYDYLKSIKIVNPNTTAKATVENYSNITPIPQLAQNKISNTLSNDIYNKGVKFYTENTTASGSTFNFVLEVKVGVLYRVILLSYTNNPKNTFRQGVQYEGVSRTGVQFVPETTENIFSSYMEKRTVNGTAYTILLNLKNNGTNNYNMHINGMIIQPYNVPDPE